MDSQTQKITKDENVGVKPILFGAFITAAFILATIFGIPALIWHEQKVALAMESPFEIEKLLVNVNGTKFTHSIRSSFEFDAPAVVVAELKNRNAEMRELISIKLASKTLDELSNSDIINRVKKEVLFLVNGKLKSGQVSKVFVMEFLILLPTTRTETGTLKKFSLP